MELKIVWLVPLVVLVIAMVCDLRSREIPDFLSLLLLAWGVIGKLAGWIELPWVAMLLGMLLGFILTAISFYLGGLGGGDAKLISALGLAIGPVGLVITLFWMALAGGVLALIAKLRGEKDYAYVPAILAGWLGCIGFELFLGRPIV